MTIHSKTEIHPTAKLGKGVTVGPFTTIGANAQIGEGTEIGPSVVIERGTIIGKNCRIYHGASLGGDPQIINFKDVPSTVQIGDETTIREFVTIHRARTENGKTLVGNGCFLMAYSHIAHDCDIGDQVIIVNSAGLAGHIVVEEQAVISGLVGIHQRVRIGKNAMVGALAGVNQDVLPFCTVEGTPARLLGINSIGLKRAGFEPHVRSAIKKAIHFLLRSDLNTSQAMEKIEQEIENQEEIRYLISFIKNSSRGITK